MKNNIINADEDGMVQTKSGEMVPVSSIIHYVEKEDGRVLIKYEKFSKLAGVERKMVCYDEIAKPKRRKTK